MVNGSTSNPYNEVEIFPKTCTKLTKTIQHTGTLQEPRELKSCFVDESATPVSPFSIPQCATKDDIAFYRTTLSSLFIKSVNNEGTLHTEPSKVQGPSNNLEFPITLTDIGNIYKYFSICDLNVIYDHEVLIYVIKIPLVQKQLNNLFNLIPLLVPYTNSSVYSYINPSYPFLLLSATRTHYGRLRDLSACKKISLENYLCSEIVVYLASETPVCQTILGTDQPDNLTEDCPSRTNNADIEVWHPLSANSWLYHIISPRSPNQYKFLMKFNGNNLDELRHSKQKLEQFNEILEENIK
ncbi:uncharacterized protein LOC132704467 [Cylas formicarius]|uniref:uncharacterized protein LOC132704467 n=1 Tax=Cylas formicarius TaxID=197179 RepID=UPI0029587762|nr:uncharacterized protein LOC132704467 [Cylas formicarius]